MKSITTIASRVRAGAIIAALATAGALGAAAAQEQSMPGMSQEGGGMRMHHEGMMRGMMCRMGEHVEGKLAFLKAELKITDAQAPQWNAYADAFRANRKKMAQQCAAMREHGEHGRKAVSTLPERLDMMERHMSTHLESLRAIKGPLQSLYAVLGDEQKKTADRILRGPMGIGMMGMRGMGMRGMGMTGKGMMGMGDDGNDGNDTNDGND